MALRLHGSQIQRNPWDTFPYSAHISALRKGWTLQQEQSTAGLESYHVMCAMPLRLHLLSSDCQNVQKQGNEPVRLQGVMALDSQWQ